MAYIGKKPEDAFRGLAYYDTFTGDGSTTTFDLSADAPDGGQNDITVVVDNVRQEPGASKSYTLGVDGSGRYRRVTFNTAPDNLSEIYVINPGRSTQLNTVSDNAITAAKLQTDAVTTAKIQDDAVTTAKILDDAVTSAKIADGTIVSSNIAPGTIANDRLANTGITINGTTIALGASGDIVAGTDWQAVVTADGSTATTASAGEGYFIDTTSNAHTINLPSSPTQGDEVTIVDYAGTFGTNNVTIGRNGSNIDGVATDGTLSTNRLNVRFVYIDATQGWKAIFDDASVNYGTTYISATGGTITTSGDYKIHTFTGDGCFAVSTVGVGAGPSVVDYLVVAGGGGGGHDYGSGGGAGGFRISNSTCMPAPLTSPLASSCGVTVTATTYPITVGAGGSIAPSDASTNGSNSIFSTITSTGGGRGRSGGSNNGVAGGSGSGAAGPGTPGQTTTGGAGNTPPVSPPQGNSGGNAPPSNGAATQASAGGGGAGAAGGNGSVGSVTGTGGNGSYVLGVGFAGCNGTSGPVCGARYFAGGASGGGSSVPTAGAAGIGGGGKGSTPGDVAPTPGTACGVANTGGGGGGMSSNGSGGGDGGKGIVIIRYKYQN